jgi:putative hydrolase of the HAD superfamily
MPRQPCEALLVDLDGVLRVFDPGHVAAVEQRHGLPAGALAETAFHWDRLRPVITGRISHDEWLARVGAALGAPDAVAEWFAYRGEVNAEVLEWVRQVRAAGIPVAIASNATDCLDADLDKLGLRDEVDAVVNSSVVGHHKPTAEFFAAACAAVRTPLDRCLLVDDDHRHVAGARVAGLAAYRYSEPGDLRYVRAALRVNA